jgi:hypothetical protein
VEKLKDIADMDITRDLSFIHLIQNASVLGNGFAVVGFIGVMVVHIP